MSFWLRNKIPYGVLMRHEHINSLAEIESIIKFFFKEVRISRYPLPFVHVSLYSYIEASSPNVEAAKLYLKSQGILETNS